MLGKACLLVICAIKWCIHVICEGHLLGGSGYESGLLLASYVLVYY